MIPLSANPDLHLSGLIPAASYLSTTYKTSFAVEHALQSATVILLVSGAAVILCDRFLPSSSRSDAEYIPLDDRDGDATSDSRHAAPSRANSTHVYGNRALRAIFALTVLLICARVVTLRVLVENSQCLATSWTVSTRHVYHDVGLIFRSLSYLL